MKNKTASEIEWLKMEKVAIQKKVELYNERIAKLPKNLSHVVKPRFLGIVSSEI